MSGKGFGYLSTPEMYRGYYSTRTKAHAGKMVKKKRGDCCRVEAQE
jgi:signal peptidase I